MKMFVVLALVAAAVAEPEAEADAQYLYGANNPYVASPFVRTASSLVSTYANTYINQVAPLVRSYTPYNYAYATHHNIGKREAEAEADPAHFYGSYAPVTTYAANTYTPYVASPVVRTVAAPVVRTVAAPVVRTVASPVVQTVASPFVRALASHHVTSYNSPNHYTAVSNGVFGPKYIAKNGAVQHVVKREAEAEADPALLYNAVPAYTSAYAAAPLTTTYNNVAAPLTTTYNVAAPLTTTYNVAAPLTTTYNVAAPVVANTYNHVAAPLTTAYNVAAPLTTTYNVAAPVVAKSYNNAVAATTQGLVHSSHVGVCVNTYGQQVQC